MLFTLVTAYKWDVFNQPLGTPIKIEKCTTSGGRTKEANERSFVFVHHGHVKTSYCQVMGHFRVHVRLLFKASLSAKFL